MLGRLRYFEREQTEIGRSIVRAAWNRHERERARVAVHGLIEDDLIHRATEVDVDLLLKYLHVVIQTARK